MEVLLHKVCGRPASRTMTLRAAGPEDAAAFYALQNEVRAAMPHPEQFVPDTLENIARYLKEDLCIGGGDGGRRRRGEYLFAGKPEIRLRGEGLPPGSARKAPLHGQRGHDRVRGADSVPPRQFCGARSQRQGFHSLAKLPVRTIRKL